MDKVIFKKFTNGDVIALFPDDVCDYKGNIQSYMHIGQHGGATPDLLTELEDASPDEYANLKQELINIGYELA